MYRRCSPIWIFFVLKKRQTSPPARNKMPPCFFGLQFGAGSPRSLSARGQCLNIFLGIGFFFLFALLSLGGYLIEQEFANPMPAPAVGFFFSALVIAPPTPILVFPPPLSPKY